MGTKKTAVEYLEQVVAEHPRSPGSQRVMLTLDAARDLHARIAMLTDAVVAAASLWFGEIKDESERDYASEELHEMALDLVKTTPRLKGAFKGGGI